MKNIAFTFICLLFVVGLSAQDQRCHSEQALSALIAENPAIAADIAKEKELVQKNRSAFRASNSQGTYEIPVVVHVVYKTAAQNISTAQIMSQLRVLNEDFEAENADTALIPAAFKPFLGDADIDFCLAQTDPDGFYTTGITRTQTNVNSFTFDDKVKSSSTGGKDPWPRNDYLNIWVCNLGGGILGYAYPPGAPANIDGVVIGYQYFGSIDDNDGSFVIDNTYNKGRTTTHEVGHWLSLDHVWGGGSGCENDFASDTPLQDGPNYGCPSFPTISTCNGNDNGPDGDMFMNFMDYVDDDCMHMFTDDQCSNMQSALTFSRPSILLSTGCNPGIGASIEENIFSSVKLYPNPANEQLNLEFDLASASEVIVQLFNSQGQSVYSNIINESKTGLHKVNIPTGELSEGLYHVELISGAQQLNKAVVIAR